MVGEGRQLTLIQPDLCINGVWDVDLGKLREAGITDILIDIDNTIAPWGGYEIPPAVVDWLERAKSLGFGVCLLSNNFASRVEHFSRRLGVPAVCGWVKPWPWGFRRALSVLGVEPGRAVMIGDQLFTDVAGAKRLGLMTILVDPLSERESVYTRFKRRIERLMGRKRPGERMP
jgi:HAD superfamily phosphatase (TIGR01668 family)